MVKEVWECPEGHLIPYWPGTSTSYEAGDEEEVWCEDCDEDRKCELQRVIRGS